MQRKWVWANVGAYGSQVCVGSRGSFCCAATWHLQHGWRCNASIAGCSEKPPSRPCPQMLDEGHLHPASAGSVSNRAATGLPACVAPSLLQRLASEVWVICTEPKEVMQHSDVPRHTGPGLGFCCGLTTLFCAGCVLDGLCGV